MLPKELRKYCGTIEKTVEVIDNYIKGLGYKKENSEAKKRIQRIKESLEDDEESYYLPNL